MTSALGRRQSELAPDRSSIADACRGSADPAALAWLAEGLELEPGRVVVDIGGGSGGPAAWITARYGCSVVSIDPDRSAVRAGVDSLGVVGVVGDGAALPIRGTIHAALLLGVLSMSASPSRVLAEARRLTDRLGVLAWCSHAGPGLRIGPSTFPDLDGLVSSLTRSGWSICAGPELAALPPPATWRADDQPHERDPAERAVRIAAEEGHIAPFLVIARH